MSTMAAELQQASGSPGAASVADKLETTEKVVASGGMILTLKNLLGNLKMFPIKHPAIVAIVVLGGMLVTWIAVYRKKGDTRVNAEQVNTASTSVNPDVSIELAVGAIAQIVGRGRVDDFVDGLKQLLNNPELARHAGSFVPVS